MRAFAYLAWTSARNRVLSQLTRARKPRYILALLVGVVYLWAFLFRPTGSNAARFLVSNRTETVATLFALFSVLGTWALGGDRTALGYTEAEVAFLFPAPLTRRTLVLYKLYRAQIMVVINTLIWVFIFRRGGTFLPSVYRAVGLWVMFSTLNLHRLGAAMVRASWVEHRAAGIGFRRNWAATLAFVALLGIVAATVVSARARISAGRGPGELLSTVAAILTTPPASVALYPFHLVVAPTFARSVPAWRGMIWPALLVLAFHFIWVLQADAAFEDAAVEASAERARRSAARRSRGYGFRVPAAKPARALPLKPTGHPATAIVWKNTLCLVRTVELRLFASPVVAAAAIGLALESDGWNAGRLVASCSIALVAMLLLFGARIVRNDFRHDMLNLSLLKTLPVSARDMVVAEISAAAVPMAAAELVLVAAAFVAVAASASDFSVPRSIQSGIMFGAPFGLLSLNGAIFTIENARAVVFPAWTPLGAQVGSRIEALGQNVLGMIAALIVLGVALIPPVFVGGLVYAGLSGRPATGVAAAIVGGSIILGAETFGAFVWLGSAFGKAEPLETL